MKNLFALLAAVSLATLSQASVLDTQTRPNAENAPLYATYHDGPTDYVYVRLPAGWSFVGRDAEAHSHEVFRDASTGFVYVKLSEGWKFMPATSGQ